MTPLESWSFVVGVTALALLILVPLLRRLEGRVQEACLRACCAGGTFSWSDSAPVSPIPGVVPSGVVPPSGGRAGRSSSPREGGRPTSPEGGEG